MSSNLNNTINLEMLQNKYSGLLQKYNTAVNNYINYVNEQTLNNAKPQFVNIKGYSYNGTGKLSNTPNKAKTVQQCEASCANTSKCSGATFIASKCYLSEGDSNITPSTSSSYAVITVGKQMLLNIDSLNQELLSVNGEIQNLIKSDNPIYDKLVEENSIANAKLLDNYAQLLEERKRIEDMINEYNTLSETEDMNQIMVTKRYYTYILLVILSVAIIILLYKMSNIGATSTPAMVGGGSGDLGFGAYAFVFILIIVVVILNYVKI